MQRVAAEEGKGEEGEEQEQEQEQELLGRSGRAGGRSPGSSVIVVAAILTARRRAPRRDDSYGRRGIEHRGEAAIASGCN